MNESLQREPVKSPYNWLICAGAAFWGVASVAIVLACIAGLVLGVRWVAGRLLGTNEPPYLGVVAAALAQILRGGR